MHRVLPYKIYLSAIVPNIPLLSKGKALNLILILLRPVDSKQCVFTKFPMEFGMFFSSQVLCIPPKSQKKLLNFLWILMCFVDPNQYVFTDCVGPKHCVFHQ